MRLQLSHFRQRLFPSHSTCSPPPTTARSGFEGCAALSKTPPNPHLRLVRQLFAANPLQKVMGSSLQRHGQCSRMTWISTRRRCHQTGKWLRPDHRTNVSSFGTWKAVRSRCCVEGFDVVCLTFATLPSTEWWQLRLATRLSRYGKL
jgi:hypothetical protein